MKKLVFTIVSLVFVLCWANFVSAQTTTVFKSTATATANQITGNLVVGAGKSITTTGGGLITASGISSMTSAALRTAITDESGTGALLFAGGDIGAATGTSLALSGAATAASYSQTIATNTNPVVYNARNTSAGNDSSVLIQLGNDVSASASQFIMHGSANSVWPSTLKIGTGISGSPVVFVTNSSERARITDTAFTATGNGTFSGTGTHTFGTGNTVTMAAGVLTANGGLIGKGTTTNDNAAAGYVGEYVSSSVLRASAVSLTTATVANVTSLVLSAGDWDVSWLVAFQPAGSTVHTTRLAGISQVNGTTLPNIEDGARLADTYSSTGGTDSSLAGKIYRVSTTGTTVYLNAYSEFTVSTNVAYGVISARRVR